MFPSPDPHSDRLRGGPQPPTANSEKLSVVTGLTGTAAEVGYKVLRERGIAIIGMSVGNPYFTRETLGELLPTVATLFSSMKLFITDVPARHTFRALGDDETRAAAKARLRGNALRNICGPLIADLALAGSILNWNDSVAPIESYRSSLSHLKQLYTTNQDFFLNCNQTAAEVIAPKLKDNLDLVSQTAIAAQYIIEELAYLDSASQIHGISEYAYVYHRPWPILEKFVAGDFDGTKRDEIGFVMIRRQKGDVTTGSTRDLPGGKSELS